MKKRLLILFLFFELLACSSPRAKQSRIPASQAPVAAAVEAEDERILSQWQEENHKNFFDWPVDDAVMSRGYLPNRKRPHLGIDLAASKNTKIFAAHDGVVIYTGKAFRGYGNLVMIEGAKGWATLYAHFNTVKVKQGQKVSQGQVIGLMGRTGRATGVHLHFEIRKGRGPVDPLLYLPGGTQMISLCH
jgi:murein DD-endopeptidase MepM/ murein hydrolase activator NlpD